MKMKQKNRFLVLKVYSEFANTFNLVFVNLSFLGISALKKKIHHIISPNRFGYLHYIYFSKCL